MNKWKQNGESDEPSQEKLSVSLIDPSWELIDPNPNIHTLFLTFNNQFFWGRLLGIEVKWSPRMTLCAGVCCYEGRGGLCSVRLSLPLLKLRPRKDLIETLLHEMIHAYLFVTANNRDRDGHGPEFHKHMYRINNVAGTKISVYHSFHDEVDQYRQHIWQCNGPCRQRRPYYGLVKRSMNRAPGPNDPWWNMHQQSCGGTYTKIKEPEGFGIKKRKNGSPPDKKGRDNSDIRKFIGKGKSLSGGPSSSQGSKNNQPGFRGGNSPPMKENIPVYKGAKTNDISGNIPNAKKPTNVHGLGSTASGTVKPMDINNASRSNVHGFCGGLPANKKPKIGATGKSGKPTGGTWKGGAGGGLATKGGTGSKTVTLKGKTASKAESETNNSSNDRPALPSATPFQGQGYSLGGLQSTGVSRLLSLGNSSTRSTSQLSGPNQRNTVPSASSRSSNEYSNSEKNTSQVDESKSAKCPVCNQEFPVTEINEHLDDCIGDFDDDDDVEEWTTTPSMKTTARLTDKFKRTISISNDDSNNVNMEDGSRMSSASTAGSRTSSASTAGSRLSSASTAGSRMSSASTAGSRMSSASTAVIPISSDEETYPCPVCSERVSASKINEHLDTHF